MIRVGLTQRMALHRRLMAICQAIGETTDVTILRSLISEANGVFA
jgi:hypothetical protein